MPTAIENPFYLLAPTWALYPMIVAGICAVVCYAKIPETSHVDISSDASVASIREPAQAASTK